MKNYLKNTQCNSVRTNAKFVEKVNCSDPDVRWLEAVQDHTYQVRKCHCDNSNCYIIASMVIYKMRNIVLLGCEASAGVCSVLGHDRSRWMWINWKGSRKKMMKIIRGYSRKWQLRVKNAECSTSNDKR